MQAITEARNRLKNAVSTAEQPLNKLQQQGSTLHLKLEGLLTDLSAAAQRLSARTEQLARAIEAERRQSEAQLRALPSSQKGEAARALSDLSLAAQAAVDAQRRQGKDAQAALNKVEQQAAQTNAKLQATLLQIDGAKQDLRQRFKSADQSLSQVEARIDALAQSFTTKLRALKDGVIGTLETTRRTANTFIDETRAAVRLASEPLTEATTTSLAAVSELSRLSTDLTAKANQLTSGLQSIAASTVGALGKVKVNGLPEPLAKPAVTALEQLASSFASQLSSGAKTVASQLESAAEQMATQIDNGQSSALQGLDTALKSVLQQVDTLATGVDTQRKAMESAARSALQQLEAQKTKLLAQAQTERDAILKPALAAASNAETALASAAQNITQTVSQAVDTCTQQITAARAHVSSTEQQFVSLERLVGQTEKDFQRRFQAFRQQAIGKR